MNIILKNIIRFSSLFKVPIAVLQNGFVVFFLFNVVYSQSVQAQKKLELEICENCLNEVFNKSFKATKEALPPTNKDSVSYSFTLPKATNSSKSLLYISDADYIVVVDGKAKYYAGRFTSKNQLSSKFSRYLIPIKLGRMSREVTVKINQYDGKFFTVSPKLIIGSGIEDLASLYLSQNEPGRIVNLICIILLGLLLIYSIYQTHFLKNNIYKTYGLYLFSVIFFLLLFSDEYLQWHYLLPENLQQYGALNIFPQGIIYVLYTEFGIAFLDIKKKYPKIFKASRLFQYLTFTLTASHSMFLLISGGNQAFIYKYFFFLYAVILIFSNYLTYLVLFKIRDNNKWFLLAGSFVIGWAVSYEVFNVFANESPKPRDFFYSLPSGFMHFSFVELSYVVESLIFLMGINFKNIKKEKENKALKELIIKQLQEKEQLEKDVNKLLKSKLLDSQKKLELEQIMSENERNYAQLLQSQLGSLQLQMNPHYLFNSLNSINDFIISKKPQEASEYLALYARMMRNMLNNSNKTFNTLEQELQFSHDYLELESLRFSDRFEFKIIPPDNHELLKCYIPGMMLQPILENAIWHGIMPLQRPGFIQLSVTEMDNEGLIIQIEDNGNGIIQNNKKESYGLKNIHEKIALLHKLYGKEIKISMRNKEEENGYLVKLFIPFFSDEVMN